MIEALDLVEFRGIRRLERPLEFSRFNVLVGPNNAGKSSLLMALFLFPDPREIVPILGMAKFDPKASSDVIRLIVDMDGSSLIYRYSGVSLIKYRVDGKLSTLECGVDFCGRQAEVTDITDARIQTLISSLSEAPPARGSAYSAYIPSSDSFRTLLESSLVKSWRDVEKTEAHVRLVRELAPDVISDRFTEIIARYNERSGRNELVVRKELPSGSVAYTRLEDLGGGVKRFLTAALFIEALRPKIVLWDDIEASAHPSLVRHIIRWLAGRDWQVVISTHSVDVLWELVIAEIDDAKVIQLWKSPDDILSWKALSIEDLEEMFEKGLDARKMLRW